MKNKLVSNLGLKIVSILFSLILWLIVVNVDDPVMTKKFKDIPVNILNGNLLEQQGQVYEVLNNSNMISITVKAKRSVIEALDSSDFYATADFAERISSNSIPVKVAATKLSDKITDIELLNNTVKILIEPKQTKEIPVELQLQGTPAEGFAVGSTNVNPSTITISGPNSEVSQVEKVVVSADVKGINKDYEIILTGSLCNANNEPVDERRLSKSVEQYQVNIELLHTKSVDLDLSVQGEVAEGYRYSDMEYTPTTITIAGPESELEAVRTIQIPSTELDITGLSENVTRTIDITKYLPGSLKLVNSNEKNIKVLLHVEKLNTRTFTIPFTSIDMLNTPSGLDVSYDTNNSVSVTIQGQADNLTRLTEEDVQVSVDLKGKIVGRYTTETTVKVPDGFTVKTFPVVTLVLQSRGETSVTTIPTTTDNIQDHIQNPAVSSTPTPTPIPTQSPQESAE